MSDETTPDLTAILAEHLSCSCPALLTFPLADHLAYWITAAGFGPVRAVEAERDAARAFVVEAMQEAGHDLEQAWARAESAEAALAGLREGIERVLNRSDSTRPGLTRDREAELADEIRALLAATPDREEARDE